MNDKVKAIFFAQYYGQRIMTSADNTGAPIPISIPSPTYMGDFYLLLRSINDLTDEEYINIAKIVYLNGDTNDVKCRNVGMGIVSEIKYEFGCGAITWEQVDCINSFLRLKGVATSFTYLNDQNQPETYSVEKLCELGWVMIKTNN